MEKRYQVFVSSTFSDLQDERKEVMNALLELDCIPSGMELFPAANETQWNLIKRVIDDCDYYVLIVAGRYGSLGPDGLSFTEMEYNYALSKGKPTIAFIHKNPGNIISAKTENTNEGKKNLDRFRGIVEKKLCKHWESAVELGSVVSRSLVQLMKSTTAVGWVRANELADRDATMELLRLRRSVEELQGQLDAVRISAPKGSEHLSQGDSEFEFKYFFNGKAPGDDEWYTYREKASATWNAIFGVLAPMMIHEASDGELKSSLEVFITNNERPKKYATEYQGYSLRTFTMENDDFQTIKIQMRALGLIKQSTKPRSVKNSGTYWTLTPYGDEVMTQLRAILKLPRVIRVIDEDE